MDPPPWDPVASILGWPRRSCTQKKFFCVSGRITIPNNSKVLSTESETIIFSKTKNLELKNNNQVIIQFDLDSILESLYKKGIQSVIVEGGAYTIQKFLDNDKWDCIRIFKSNKNLNGGLDAPNYEVEKSKFKSIEDDKFYEIFKN